MRSAFETMVAVVSTVTLPVCLVESGAAAPLIAVVYGTRWLPAGHALTWLALLAGLQIFFTLAFDYFVVLAMSRVVFTLQAVWLLFLVPGLVLGARVHGIVGASLAELAVAAAIPLPWYLFELHKAGSNVRTLAARFGFPLAGAGVAGLAAAGISGVVPSALTALCCSALAGLLVTGLLLFRMRHVLASLRQRFARSGAGRKDSGRQPDHAGPISAATIGPAAEAAPSSEAAALSEVPALSLSAVAAPPLEQGIRGTLRNPDHPGQRAFPSTGPRRSSCAGIRLSLADGQLPRGPYRRPGPGECPSPDRD